MDFPTPPFPLTIAITFFMLLFAWGASIKLFGSREEQFSPQLSQLWVQFVSCSMINPSPSIICLDIYSSWFTSTAQARSAHPLVSLFFPSLCIGYHHTIDRKKMQVPKHAISPINVQILFRNSPLFRESLSQASKYGIIIALAIIRAGRAVSEANNPLRGRVQAAELYHGRRPWYTIFQLYRLKNRNHISGLKEFKIKERRDCTCTILPTIPAMTA